MIVLMTHMGLGDAILQAGLCVALSKRHGEIAVPCYPQYLASVTSFFVNYPHIHVFEVPHQHGFAWGSPPDWAYEEAIRTAGLPDSPSDRLRLGIYKGKGTWTDFSRHFYDGVGLNYEERFESCPVLEAAESVDQLEWVNPCADNTFLHHDPSRGYHITRIDPDECYLPTMVPGESILRYVNLIQTASLIAVIDSAFLHLCNCLTLTGKAQLHCYARWPRPRDFRYGSRNQWEYLF